MGRKYTGRPIRRQAEVRQKNGDIYVYDRIYQYDRDKKKTIVTYNKLIEKRRASSVLQEDGEKKGVEPESAQRPLTPVRKPAQDLSFQAVKSWCEKKSGIKELLILIFSAQEADHILRTLWRQILSAEEDTDAYPVFPGDLPALLARTRLEAGNLFRPEASVFRRHGAWAVLTDACGLLGILPLNENLALGEAFVQAAERWLPGTLPLPPVYLDMKVSDGHDLQLLRQNALSYVCRLSAKDPAGRAFLAQSQFFRLSDGQFIPEETAWAFTVPLEAEKTLRMSPDKDSEVRLHFCVLSALKAAKLLKRKKDLQDLLIYLNTGGDARSLSKKQHRTVKKYLWEEEKGRWTVKNGSLEADSSAAGTLMLLTNTTADSAAVLERHRKARQLRHQYFGNWHGMQDLIVRLLRDCLFQELEQLLAAASGCGTGDGSVASAAAVLYLKEASPSELPGIFAGPSEKDTVLTARNARIRTMIAQIMETKKETAVR